MGHAMQFFPSLNSTKFSLYSIRIDFLLSRNLSLWYYQRVISPTPLSLSLSLSLFKEASIIDIYIQRGVQ